MGTRRPEYSTRNLRKDEVGMVVSMGTDEFARVTPQMRDSKSRFTNITAESFRGMIGKPNHRLLVTIHNPTGQIVSGSVFQPYEKSEGFSSLDPDAVGALPTSLLQSIQILNSRALGALRPTYLGWKTTGTQDFTKPRKRETSRTYGIT